VTGHSPEPECLPAVTGERLLRKPSTFHNPYITPMPHVHLPDLMTLSSGSGPTAQPCGLVGQSPEFGHYAALDGRRLHLTSTSVRSECFGTQTCSPNNYVLPRRHAQSAALRSAIQTRAITTLVALCCRTLLCQLHSSLLHMLISGLPWHLGHESLPSIYTRPNWTVIWWLSPSQQPLRAHATHSEFGTVISNDIISVTSA
jgi:hypothetical protein